MLIKRLNNRKITIKPAKNYHQDKQKIKNSRQKLPKILKEPNQAKKRHTTNKTEARQKQTREL
jgi:hypothetical protein